MSYIIGVKSNYYLRNSKKLQLTAIINNKLLIVNLIKMCYMFIVINKLKFKII